MSTRTASVHRIEIAVLPLLRVAGFLAFTLALPIAIVTTNVRWLATDPSFYRAQFAASNVASATGFAPEELERLTATFIRYFEGPPSRLEASVSRDGAAQPVFNARELDHMEDVQALMHGVYRLQGLSLATLAAVVAPWLLWCGQTCWRRIANATLAGSALTLVVLVAAGLLALTDFQWLFLQFHLLSFTNDLWQLDPSRDNLIRLFPAEFFFAATLRVALLSLLATILLGTAAILLRQWAPAPRRP